MNSATMDNDEFQRIYSGLQCESSLNIFSNLVQFHMEQLKTVLQGRKPTRLPNSATRREETLNNKNITIF